MKHILKCKSYDVKFAVRKLSLYSIIDFIDYLVFLKLEIFDHVVSENYYTKVENSKS
jgi:hypothetical protein